MKLAAPAARRPRSSTTRKPGSWLTGLALLAAVVGGCTSDGENWALKDITGLLPRLAFELTDHRGEPVSAADYRGEIVMVYFGFTHCPHQCPMTLSTLSRALRTLPAELRSQVRVLFVTVDPERDTRQVLSDYVTFFGESFVGLRGPHEELREVSKRYRLAYSHGEPDAKGNYEVTHSSAVFIFGPDGEPRLLARRSDTANTIAADLARLAAEAT